MPTPPDCLRQWLTEREVSSLIGISVSSLQKQRFQRRGIPYAKLGRSVRYALEDVEKFMLAQRIQPGTPGGSL